MASDAMYVPARTGVIRTAKILFTLATRPIQRIAKLPRKITSDDFPPTSVSKLLAHSVSDIMKNSYLNDFFTNDIYSIFYSI